MTGAKPTATEGRHPRRPILLDDLADLDADSPFRQKVEKLRWFIAEHPRPLEEWTPTDIDEFIQLAEHDSFAVGLALASRNLNVTATAENPHRTFAHNDE